MTHDRKANSNGSATGRQNALQGRTHVGKDIDFFGAEEFGVSGRPTPFSPAVRAGKFVFVSGLIPRTESGVSLGGDGDVVEQTQVIMANLMSTLALAGCDLTDVVKTNVYLCDSSDFADFNDVYSSYFTDGN